MNNFHVVDINFEGGNNLKEKIFLHLNQVVENREVV